MPLNVSSPYPVDVDLARGHAVVRVSSPHQLAFDKVNEELVTHARRHARDWDAFAETLEALMAHGWALQTHAGILATRSATAEELPALVADALGEGLAVQWCTVDAGDGLFPVGGLIARCDPPADTFPGSTLPALVANELTGAQRIVGSEDELRAVVREELLACAAWWRTHPEAMSDHAAHDLPDELDELAASLEHEPVPQLIAEPVNPGSLFKGEPQTRVHVHAVSAIVFTGMMEAARDHSSLTLALEGLAVELKARASELARERGIIRET